MEIDLELYRQDVRVSIQPPVRLSLIDIAPDQARQTMLFLHGFAGWAMQWKYQLFNFSTTKRVIAIDLRGHGQSDKPSAGYSMEQIQIDLQTTLDILGVNEKLIMIGHSFGGAVATEFAATNPQRVSHLVLIATAGEYRLNPLYRFLLNLPSRSLQVLTPFTRRWLGAPPHVLKAWYADNLSIWNGWSLFRDLRVPTLVIRGHQDRIYKKSLTEEMIQAIPDAEEANVGASGHMVMLERREAVNRAIERFIDPSKLSFSQSRTSPVEIQLARLIKGRTWLAHYDQGVPFTISVPQVPLHQLLRSSAHRFPSHHALIFEGKRISYKRLNREANRFSNALRSLGIKQGDRVMLIMPNLPQLVIAFFGTLKLGAVAVFSLPLTEGAELIRQIQDSGAKVLVTLSQFDDLIYRIKTQLEPGGKSPLKHIIFTQVADYLPMIKRLWLQVSRKLDQERLLHHSISADTHAFKRILNAQSCTAPGITVLPQDLAVIQYTGGTTAHPKGVALSHRNLVANALQTRHWMSEAQEGKERFLSVLPFSHIYGLTAGLNVPIGLCATILLKPKFEAGDVLRTIHKYHPTVFPGVPQMYAALKDFPGVRRYGISSIKACISGSAPLPMEVQEAFEKLTRGRLVEGYGLTEASPVTHANPLKGLRKVGSIGIPLPSTEARIVDLRKGLQEMPAGQIGELAVRGPQVMMGYWRNPKATRRVLSSEGWLLTGDVAQMDDEGYYRIIARKADMWYPKKPGKPAFPRDLEEVLFEIPQIKEAAVVAIARQPIAFLISEEDRPTTEAIIAYCKRRLPPELVPRLVIFVEDFPRTFIGKVLRRELAQNFKESTKYVK